MICFAGPLPPPVHGMANVNLAMIGRLRERARVIAISVTPGMRGRISAHVIKLFRAAIAVAGIVIARLRGATTFYGSADDGLGGFCTAAFALTARACGMRIFLHYHSFLYIERTTLPMRLVTRSAGPAACHVMLCQCMAERFRGRYRAARSVIVAPNAVPDDPSPASARTMAPTAPLTLGLLSNLSFEKGLAQFTQLVERLRQEGLSIRGVLAGPAADQEALRHIEQAMAGNGDALEWRGPVSGERKERFFHDVDVFVFPTDYPTEAYPLVVIEALVHGLPVITKDRGCIGDFASLGVCTVHPRDGDFVAAAVPQIAAFARDPASLAQARSDAQREGRALNASNRRAIDALVDAIVGSGSQSRA
jgi:glycosyltransferase involved in cell wall biosynthesis